MRTLYANLKSILKRKSYFSFYVATCVLFIAFCGIAVYREQFQMPLIVFGLLIAYLVVVHTEKTFYLTVFLIPFSIELDELVPGMSASVSVPSEFFLAMTTVMVILKMVLDSQYPLVISKHKISLAILFYLFWMFLTSITSSMPIISFKFLAAKIWFIVPAYFFFAQLLKKDLHNAFKLLLCYATALVIVVLITTYKQTNVGGIRDTFYLAVAPFYNDHTAYGAILAFFSPILAIIPFIKALPKRVRQYSAVLLVPVLVGLFLSFSRAAWLSVIFAAGVCVILLLKIKLRTIILLSGAIVGLLFAFQTEIMHQLNRNTQDSSAGNFAQHFRSITNITSDDSNVERLNRWQAAINMCKQKPVMGWGPRTYQFNYAPFQTSHYKTGITTNTGTHGCSHSEYFGPLAETGILGMISVVAMIAIVLTTGIKTYHRTQNQTIKLLVLACVLANITYFFHGILNEFLDTEKLAIPVFATMAIITVCNIQNKEHGTGRTTKDSLKSSLIRGEG